MTILINNEPKVTTGVSASSGGETDIELSGLRRESGEPEKSLRIETATAGENLEQILSSISDGFIAVDRKWQFIYLNAEGAKIIGRKPEEALGKNLWDEFPELKNTVFGKLFLRVADERLPGTVEDYYLPFDSWFNVRAYPNENGLTIFFLNVTERKRAAYALRESEETLTLAMQSSQMGAWSRDLATEAVYWSAELEQIFGLRRGTFAGNINGFYDYVYEADRELLAHEVKTALNEHRDYIIEFRFHHASGELRWMEGRGKAVYAADGTPTKVYGIGIDITTRKRDEAALRESEERFRHVADAAPVLIWISDTTKKCTWFNKPWLKFTGRTMDEEYGDGWAEGVHPEDFERCVETYFSSFDARQSFSMEYRLRRHDGEYRWLLDNGAPRFAPNGEFLGYIGSCIDIAEQKSAVEELRSSEEKFRNLANSISQFAWMTDETGYILWYNERWYEYTGTSLEEMQGWGWQSVHDPAEVDRVIKKFKHSIETGEVWEDTFPLRSKTGEYRWFLSLALPIRDEAGKIVRWFGTNTDIHEQKQEEINRQFLFEVADKIRRAEQPDELVSEMTSLIGKHLPAARCHFAEIDLDGDTVTVHRDYFRENMSSLAGTYSLTLFNRESINDLAIGKTVVFDETKTDRRTADLYESGYRPFDVEAFVSVPLLRDGRLVASLTVVADTPRRWSEREISLLEMVAERVWLAVEKLRINFVLRQSEERLRLATETAALGTWDYDYVNQKMLWSNRLFEIFGMNPTENGETTLDSWSARVHPEDLAEAFGKTQQARLEKRPHNHEYRIVRADNSSTSWISTTAQFFYDAGDKATRAVGVVQDITTRKQSEIERERLLMSEQNLRRESEEANRLKDEFLATVSHELRTPLNAILGWSMIARNSGLNGEMVTRAFDVIERNGRNQNQLISDILDVSRVITGKLNLDIKEIELTPIAQSAVETVRPAFEGRQITLITNLENELIFAGDENRLQQIIWNLLSNAIKFTPPGGEIRFSVTKDNSMAKLVVSDTGEGIAPEFLPFVFDRFRQADGAVNRRHGGLGLGLAIVRHLTELHGGMVAVESAGLGKGATFTVRLPLAALGSFAENQTAANLPAPSSNGASLGNSANRILQNLQVLVVDDERDAREFLSFILVSHGAKISTADSATVALDKLKSESPDLLISDIGMPGEDGYSLMRKIRASNNLIPAIALTAYARQEDGAQALAAGYNIHLPKPAGETEIITAIAALTNRTA